ncbi:MAG: DNA internalization-related competence protein ComEC/Rec2 [Lachnospiraceae bacterium]|nr:DNA internalization-related competence protein ComEC/Rec2 [Lachnospiraceae bacterium]
MIKRKLFFAALLFALLCFGLQKTGTIRFLHEMPEENRKVVLTGIIDQIESKTDSKYVYLKRAQNSNSGETYGKIILTVADGIFEKLDLKLGERVKVYGKYTGFHVARNAGNFDENNYYHSLGISGKFQLENPEDLKKTGKGWNYLKQWLYEVKTSIVDTFESVMTGFYKPIGIFSAIVAGEKSGLDQNVKELYQTNGIAHILAISGLHISLIGMSVFSILRKRHSYKFSCLISSLVMVGFCVMSGGSVSAIRATIMFLVRMLAELFGKTFDLLSALAFAAILILAENPLILTNGAFLLSFGAILGVGVINIILVDYCSSESRLLKAFSVSLSVSLATLPIITSIYYEIPLYSVFLNLLIIPLMSFVLGSGILCGIAGSLSIVLGRFIIGMGVYLLSFVEILCKIIDWIPYSIVVTGKPALWKVGLFYLLLVSGLVFMKQKAKKGKRLLQEKTERKVTIKRIVFLLLWGIVLFSIFLFKEPSEKLQLTFFDVGQGEGYLIQSPSGTNFLMDGGSTSVNNLKEYRLESAIKYLGVSTVDYSIITHPDTDHISGVMDLIQDDSAGHILIKNLVVADLPGNEKMKDLKELAQTRNIPVITMQAGDVLSDGAIRLTCLHPEENYKAKDTNGESLVFLLEYNKFRALLTGDIGMEEEQRLLEEDLENVRLLKVAHHGSRTSSSEPFLQEAFSGSLPKVAIISAGVNNSYGHPNKETLQRLRNLDAEIFCTAATGEITVSIDETGTMTTKKYLLNF